MKYDLRKPCNECPYTCQWAGWLGDHEHPQEFIDLVSADERFPCHKTAEWEPCHYGETVGNGWPCERPGCNGPGCNGVTHIGSYPQHCDPQHCAGYAALMNQGLKRSRDPEMAAFQARIREAGVTVPTAPEIVRRHLEAMR